MVGVVLKSVWADCCPKDFRLVVLCKAEDASKAESSKANEARRNQWCMSKFLACKDLSPLFVLELCLLST